MFHPHFVDKTFQMAHDLQQMRCCLTPSQTVLLKCLVLTAVESQHLQAPRAVEEIRHLLLNCLRRSLRSQRSRWTTVKVTSTEDCVAESLAVVHPIKRVA